MCYDWLCGFFVIGFAGCVVGLVVGGCFGCGGLVWWGGGGGWGGIHKNC